MYIWAKWDYRSHGVMRRVYSHLSVLYIHCQQGRTLDLEDDRLQKLARSGRDIP